MFSILVANYNNGRFLEEAFRSILSQTEDNWEVIIVDDGSNDNSIDIIQPYLANSRFKLFINEKNFGCGYTKRRCIDLANGNICGFLDPDDTLMPDAIALMCEAHAKCSDCALVFSDHYLCDEKLENKKIAAYTGAIQSGFSYLVNPNRKVIHHFASFKKVLYQKTNGLNAALKKAVDQDLYYVLEEAGHSFYINKPLYNYRIHDKGISTYKNIIPAAIVHFKIRLEAFERRKHNAIINLLYPKDKTLFQYQQYRSKMYLSWYSRKFAQALAIMPLMFFTSPSQFIKDYVTK